MPRRWRVLGVICVGVVVVGLTRALPVEDAVAVARSWAAGQGAPGMFAFGGIYVVAALLFVPGAALTLLAGGIFGIGWGIVIVAIATSVADAVAFVVGRYLARDIVIRLTRRYPRFGAVEEAITTGGWRVVALLRLSPTFPYSASNYLFGLTGIRFLPYLITSGIFTLPGICAYVYLGYVGAETVGGTGRSPMEWVLLGIGLAATLTATIYLAVLARRALDRLS